MATAKKKPTIVLSPSRDIPFNQLVLSQSNVRRIKAGVSIEELAEDIARRGILQGLTVRPVIDEAGAETGMFEVPAGGRRFRALELLVKQKRLAKSAPVPCVVREGGIAEEDSLAENVQRAPLHPLDQFRAFLTLREKGQAEEEIAATFFVSVNVVKQRLKLASVSPALLDVYAEDGMTLAQLEAFTVSGDHERQEQVFERLKTSYDKSAHTIRRMLTEGAIRGSDKRAQFIGIDAYVEAGGTVLRDLFEGDDGGWLQHVPLVEQMVASKLRTESEAIATEGWKWTEVAPDFAYGHTYGLRRLHGEPVPLTAEEEATRDALKAEFDRMVAEHEGADELPDEVDERLGELETALEAFGERPLSFDLEEIARAGAFISIAGDGRLRVDRGYVRPEDEAPLASEADASDGKLTSEGSPTGVVPDAADGANDEATTEPEEDEGLSPISDRLMTELTAHRTLGLRHALGEHPDVAFRAALHALTLKVFYQYGSDSCLELDLKTVSFGTQAPGLNDSVSAEAIRARHENWAKALPKASTNLWDALGDWDTDSRAALFAHVVSLSVNAVHEAWNRRPRALAHADKLAEAVDLDMAPRWKPTVDTFLGRVTKARILQAVVEAKGQRVADRIGHLKKGDMATEAETLLADIGWLPEPLRAPVQATELAVAPSDADVEETAGAEGETTVAEDDRVADDDDVAKMTIAAE
ncbi:ParB/RepB/Spo0J family partition protein [Aminobacter anthyllidis]|uniref:ParB/RepB/Spo0J family partition protein n=1 Tax=Aminobacter anthyllidis TaxID=1035067 RepID=A0A9X1D474_9HYPH|nr:ParB/RepB/Spo0J family partition protein [Aminobacter anthyllidis]MBT1155867.1 ParB/RepB/Spo0J family partition protein [Aminobacter anthyllidis]